MESIESTNTALTNIAGWVPGIIIPTATLIQFIKIKRSRSAEGVSVIALLLFGFANIGLYVFTEKYWALQSLIGLLGTAIIDFAMVAIMMFVCRFLIDNNHPANHGWWNSPGMFAELKGRV